MSWYNSYSRGGYGCNSCSNTRNTNSCGYSNNNSCGCSNNNHSCGCSGVGGQSTNGCGCGNKHHYPFPPQNSVCGTCPPGTRPCNPCYNPCWNGCGCGCNNGCGNNNCGCNNGCGNNNCGCNNGCGNNNCGCNNGCGNNGGCDNHGGNNGRNVGGTYAFFNSTGSTLTTGSIIPLRYVIGSGDLGRGTTGGTVGLDAGIYSVEYSLNATADTEGATITITPEYLGALHPEYSRSFTTTAEDQTFDFAGSFVVNLPTDTTLSLNVTITEPADSTATTTLTDVNASMLIRRISGSNNN